MATWSYLEDEDKKRFWNYILTQTYGTTDMSQVKDRKYRDLEGHAFFLAIDEAFTSCDKMRWYVPVDRELVQYMAGWGRDTTRGCNMVGGPIRPDANHFVKRAFNGFISTLLEAIKVNQLRYFEDGRIMYGCFLVPQWLIDHCLTEVQKHAEQVNQIWDEDPGSRDAIRNQR